MFELNEHTRWILGRPHFWCAAVIVPALRASGQEIAKKAEHEQAAAIHWMLQMYEEHGDKWREKLYMLIVEKMKPVEKKTEGEKSNENND